jgi:hypothetical protein
MWSQIKKDENIIFRPNLDHPVFAEFRDLLNDDQLAKAFDNCIALLGATLPIETLHADLLGASESVISDPVALDALRQQIAALVPKLLERKIPEANIPDVLRNDELIKANWAEAKPIILEILGEIK